MHSLNTHENLMRSGGRGVKRFLNAVAAVLANVIPNLGVRFVSEGDTAIGVQRVSDLQL